MLKLFGGGKSDHPMANAKEARRILDELATQDAYQALQGTSDWLDSVSRHEGFRVDQRFALLVTLDDAGQARVRKLARDYFAAERPSRFQENRMWTALHDYWQHAGRAFARCIDGVLQQSKGADALRAQVPALVVRTMRALAQQIKWMHLRYGPIDTAVWGMLNNVLAFAEARQVADTKTAPYPGGGETTPREEFLRAALFSASSPDSLLPVEADLAERLIASLSAHYAMSPTHAPALAYWTDLGVAMVPARATQAPKAAPGLRCFGAGGALGDLTAAIEKLESSGAVPSDSALTGEDPERALDVMRHLALYWSPTPPARVAPRHAVKSRLSVAHGMEGVQHALDDGGGVFVSSEDDTESWVVENVSAGGFGAMVPQLKGDWLRVGALVAVQPEGGKNWVVGIVRRVSKSSGTQARVGIQSLSRAARATGFSIAGVDGEQGIVLSSADATSPEARLLLRPAVFVPGQNIEAQHEGRHSVYMPQGIVERGEDYEIARFREMIRETGDD
ncbi:MAG TPA: hypothetical protein VIS77_03015 [Burkholderiales bacterium]